MKKMYAMGLALTVGMTAVAAPRMVKDQATTQAFQICNEVVLPTSHKAAARVAGPAKAITSINDVYGLKSWVGEGRLTSNGNQEVKNVVYFDAGANDKMVTLVNFPYGGLSCTANVDIAKKTITINKQRCEGQLNTNEGLTDVSLYTYNGFDGEGEGARPAPVPSVTGTIADDGTITFDDAIMFGLSYADGDSRGWFALQNKNRFVAMQWTTPNAAEYSTVGKGKMLEGWMNPILSPEDATEPEYIIPEYEVEILKSSVDPNYIAIKNPYVCEMTLKDDNNQDVTGNPWKLVGLMDETATGNGFILINVNEDYETCVPVMPLCDTGLLSPVMRNPDDPEDNTLVTFYCYNAEGRNFYSGGEEGLYDYADFMDSKKSPLSEVVRNDDGTATLTICNTLFGYGTNPDGALIWKIGQLNSVVTLPAGTLGIQGVTNDVENAPVRYYNLQGVEVAAPVKGQVTIKTQGGKSSKFIAR